MKNNNFKIMAAAISLLIFSFSAVVLSSVSAQSSPEFMVSWKALDYAPNWYMGKKMPIVGASVDVNFNLLAGGKPVDLSKNTVRWYVNEQLAKNENDGLGIQSLRVAVPGNTGDEMTVRISIIDYGSDVLDKTIIIPVTRPEVVIDSPYGINELKSGSYVFQAIPFFFNVSGINGLSVNWSTNGSDVQDMGNNPWQLNLTFNNQAPFPVKLNISATAKKPSNYLEIAAENIIFQTK